jgi:hypothetical protein
LYRDFCEVCGREPCICVHECQRCGESIDSKYLFLNDPEIGEYHIYHEKPQKEIVEKIQEIFKKEKIGDFQISSFTNKIKDLRCACGMVKKEQKSSHVLCSFLNVDLLLKGEFNGHDLYKAILTKYKPELAKKRFAFQKSVRTKTKTKRSIRKSKTKNKTKNKTKRSIRKTKTKTKRSIKKTIKKSKKRTKKKTKKKSRNRR